jgi:hypothetical protein
MLKFSLAFLVVSAGVALGGFAFLHLLLHLGELGVELSNNVLLLLLLEFFDSESDVVNLFEDALLQFLVDVAVLYLRVLLESQPDAQLVLQLINVLPVLQLSLAVPLPPSTQVLLNLLVFIHLSVQQCRYFTQ